MSPRDRLKASRIRLWVLLWALQVLEAPFSPPLEVPAVLAAVAQQALVVAVQPAELGQLLLLEVDLAAAQLVPRFAFQVVSVRSPSRTRLVGSESLHELPLVSKNLRNV